MYMCSRHCSSALFIASSTVQELSVFLPLHPGCCSQLSLRCISACCRDAFDAVYGSSAGAINATYFLSGQREGVNIYTDEIACKEFIDLGRLLNFSGKTQGEYIFCIPVHHILCCCRATLALPTL